MAKSPRFIERGAHRVVARAERIAHLRRTSPIRAILRQARAEIGIVALIGECVILPILIVGVLACLTIAGAMIDG